MIIYLFYYIHFYTQVDKDLTKNIKELKEHLLVLAKRIMEGINSDILIKR